LLPQWLESGAARAVRGTEVTLCPGGGVGGLIEYRLFQVGIIASRGHQLPPSSRFPHNDGNGGSSAGFEANERDNVEGQSTSPFVWRIKFALQHKGIAYESVPTGFIGIHRIGHGLAEPGTLKTLPVVEYAGRFISESWVIAEWLDEAFPDHPATVQIPPTTARSSTAAELYKVPSPWRRTIL
jgi:hypothetical protein